MGAELQADGQLWDGVPLWDDDYPIERELKPKQVHEFRAALDHARVADLDERRKAFDDEYPPDEYPDMSIDEDLADVDLTELPSSATDDIAQFNYDRDTWDRDLARRRGGSSHHDPSDSAPFGPVPYQPERDTGVITPQMAQFQLLVDVRVEHTFPGLANGQWVFDSDAGNELVLSYREPVPEGAEVIRQDRDFGGYVINEEQDVFHIPWGQPRPYNAEKVRTDAKGTWVRVSGAKLMHRFDENGVLLGRERGDGTDQRPVSIMLISHYQAQNEIRTTIFLIDVDTKRLFATSQSEHPTTMEESFSQAFAGILWSPVVAKWHDDESSPLHPMNRVMLRANRFPPDPEPETQAEPASRKRMLVYGGALIGTIAVGSVIFLTLTGGGDGETTAKGANAPPEQVTENGAPDAVPPTPEIGPAPAEAPGVETPPAGETPDRSPAVAGPPEVILEIAGDDGVSIRVEQDPEGGLSWSIVGADGQPLPASEIDEYWSMIVTYVNEAVDRMFNFSSYPCGAVTDDYRVTCPLGAGLLPEGDFIVVGATLAGPIGEGAQSFTYGLAFDDDGDDGDNYQFVAPFNADFFRNTEYWYRLDIDAAGNRTMWADGARDGVLGYPRFSSAMVIEFGDTLVWIIPRDEVPGEQLAYRLTAFHNDGDPAAVPVPQTSGGDVSGFGVDEPLTPVPLDPIVFDDLAGLPPDIDDPIPRVEVTGDPDAVITQVLVAEFADRLNTALTAGDTEAVIATVHPGLLGGPKGAECRQAIETTIALADSVEVVASSAPPDVSIGTPVYGTTATINYPTGTVAWGPVLTPGPQGRLFLLLPSCV